MRTADASLPAPYVIKWLQLMCLVYEIFFLKAPKTYCFIIEFLMAGAAATAMAMSL